jgi:hypothetical protein
VISEDAASDTEYRKIYTFRNDSVTIDELGITSTSYPIRYRKNKIYLDTVLEFTYQRQEGEIILTRPRKTISGEYDSMTLIPFNKRSLDAINIDSLKSILLQNTWEIKLYGSQVILRASFYDSLCYNLKVCPADVFNFHGMIFNRSLGDFVYWWLAEFEGHVFLIIENGMGDIYPTTYLIQEATTNKLILEYAWYGEFEQVEMIRGDLIESKKEYKAKGQQLKGTWIQKQAEFLQKNNHIEDDSSEAEFPRFSVTFFSQDSTIVYKVSDLDQNKLRVDFDDSGNFFYYLNENLMCQGEWVLSRDTDFIKMNTSYDIENFDKYTPECDDIFLEYISNDSLVFQQTMPIYYADTLVLDEPVRFFMKKSKK